MARPASRWSPVLLIGAIAVVALCLICTAGMMGAALLGLGSGTLFDERGDFSRLEAPIDGFLTHMANRRPADAAASLSPIGQSTFTLAKLNQEITGPGFTKYDGYQSTRIERVNSDVIEDVVVAGAHGHLMYRDNRAREFSATLHRVDGRWGLSDLTIRTDAR